MKEKVETSEVWLWLVAWVSAVGSLIHVLGNPALDVNIFTVVWVLSLIVTNLVGMVITISGVAELLKKKGERK